MNLSKKWTTVTPFSKFLALSMFIVLPFVGFYLGITYQNLVIQTNQPVSTAEQPFLTTTTTAELTPNLKTYTNSLNNYSFQYRSDWILMSTANEASVYVKNFPELKQLDSQENRGKEVFLVMTWGSINDPQVKQFMQSWIYELPKTGAPHPPLVLGKTLISGIPATKTSWNTTNMLLASGQTTSYFVVHNNVLLEIDLNYGYGESENTNVGKILNQILTSFKFQ